MNETHKGSVWTVFPLASHWMMCRRWEQFSQSIGHIQRKDECIDTKLQGCRWKSFPALCLAVMWLPGFPSHPPIVSLPLSSVSPPAFHTLFYVSFSSMVHRPLMLLLWSVFYDLPFSLSLSVSFFLSANLLVCHSYARIADWLWFILTPASVLWLA